MRKLLYYLLGLGFLTSCAAFGTKSKINDSGSLPAITRVALVTTKVTLPPGVSVPEVDSLFVADLAKQLTAATGWQVQYLGEVNAFMADMDNPNNSVLNGISYQAVVHAELRLAYYGTTAKVPRFNAWTRMQLISLPSKKLSGESHFNTLMGNSYGAHPILQVAIADGVTGMVRPWQKKLTQLRASR